MLFRSLVAGTSLAAKAPTTVAVIDAPFIANLINLDHKARVDALLKLLPGEVAAIGGKSGAPQLTPLGIWRWPALILALLVIASIYSGAATPTEAGAVGAGGAIVIAWSLGRLKLLELMQSLDRTIRTTAMFMLLLVGGLFSSFLLARLGIPQAMSDLLTSLPLPSWGIMIIINLVLLLLGMFMDPGSIIVIVIPIFIKSIIALGYDPVWFGVIVTIQSEIAAITPPVGFNLFVLKNVTPGANMRVISQGAIVFVIPMLICIAILTAFPGIATFLPSFLLSR